MRSHADVAFAGEVPEFFKIATLSDIGLIMSIHKDSDNSAPSRGGADQIQSQRFGKSIRREPALFAALGGTSRSNRCLIQEECKWRLPDIMAGSDQPQPRIVVSRWKGTDLREQTSEITADYHVLSVCLQPSQFSLQLGATSYSRKEVFAGMMQLTRPALPARIVYHTPYDTLHLHVKNALLKECFEWSYGKRAASEVALRDPNFSQDPLIERLGSALLSASEVGGAHSELYADSLSLTIVARLLALYGEGPSSTAKKNVDALPKWRLRRAVDFMEAHADKRISLADLAQAVGLSRMYFAAQFRKATGMRPHEYILWRRINRAKELLATTDSSIVEVALTVGFNTQAHFTAVFKRFAGSTPHSWRQCKRL
jgi:AraC family transcriptional regulator